MISGEDVRGTKEDRNWGVWHVVSAIGLSRGLQILLQKAWRGRFAL